MPSPAEILTAAEQAADLAAWCDTHGRPVLASLYRELAGELAMLLSGK